MQITLPDDLAEQLKKRVESSNEFDSVEQYVLYILEELLKRTEPTQSAVYTKEQEKAVKERLEKLGYLD